MGIALLHFHGIALLITEGIAPGFLHRVLRASGSGSEPGGFLLICLMFCVAQLWRISEIFRAGSAQNQVFRIAIPVIEFPVPAFWRIAPGIIIGVSEMVFVFIPPVFFHQAA